MNTFYFGGLTIRDTGEHWKDALYSQFGGQGTALLVSLIIEYRLRLDELGAIHDGMVQDEKFLGLVTNIETLGKLIIGIIQGGFDD